MGVGNENFFTEKKKPCGKKQEYDEMTCIRKMNLREWFGKKMGKIRMNWRLKERSKSDID